jgi:neutral ceramidase
VLDAGVAKVCISPPVGVRLAGFAARQDVCRGVHDPLYARALVLASGADCAAIVAVDVLALPAAFVDRVRQNIARKTALPADSVMIACTHTHAAPVTITTFFNPGETVDDGYMESLAAAIEQSVETAWRDRFHALAGVGCTFVKGLGVNRRSPDGLPVDDEVGILRIDDDRGQTRAVLMNYACHPTVLGPDNLLASGDFPAAAIERIETVRGAFALFVNGTEGDVSVGHSSELSAIGVIAPGRTFERAASLGTKLADAVLHSLDEIPTCADPALKTATATVDLPLKRYPSPEKATLELEDARHRLAVLAPSNEEYRKVQSDLLYASITNFYAAEAAAGNGTLSIRLQGLRIGDAVFVAIPAEVFVEIGLLIKRSAPHRTFLVGVANGYIGYLPDRASYAAGGYEVVSAKVDETAGDRLIAGVLDIERRLFADHEGYA